MLATNFDNRKKNFVSYEDAVIWAKSQNITTIAEWYAAKNSRPPNIPSEPWITYLKTGEWETWPLFVGLENLKYKPRNRAFVTYDEAKAWAKEMNITSALCYQRKVKDATIAIPFKPEIIYKRTQEWTSWRDFLDIPKLTNKMKSQQYCCYAETCRIARENNIANMREYTNWENRPECLPKFPQVFYLRTGEWKGWRTFFDRDFLSIEKARIWAKQNNIKTHYQWFNSKNRPAACLPTRASSTVRGIVY